jgi:hypothetical protein
MREVTGGCFSPRLGSTLPREGGARNAPLPRPERVGERASMAAF